MTLILIGIIAFLVYSFVLNHNGSVNIFKTVNDKKCPNCNYQIEPAFIVCPICKETLRRKCAHCGEILESSWKFCPYCKVQCKCDEVCKCNHN